MRAYTQNLVSITFHPIFVNTVGLLLLFMLFPSLTALSTNAKNTVILLITFSTVIVPILSVFILKITNQIKSYELREKEERKWPFAFTGMGYLFSFYVLQKAGISAIVLKYLLACSGTIVSIIIINNFWKISVHMASMGSILGLLVIVNLLNQQDLRIPILVAVLLAGAVGSARLFAMAHTKWQLLAGFALGFIWMFVSLYL
jgi:heme/copper-type cytochrome/quinol oxidase subunit 2